MLTNWFDITPFAWSHIFSCLICGSFIGVERQLHGKPVGVRTSTLIMLGSYCFLSTSSHLSPDVADQSRVLGQLITGIGFLGAGVMMTQNGQVTGVTSAATVWMLAALGAMIGLDMLRQAIAMTLVTLMVLVGVNWLEISFKSLQRGIYHRKKTDREEDTHDDYNGN
ncbi:TPA: MgtC/SapB family protein [Serratia marcescens]|nr:MgtC/SapB family protein [Serratia marcescens]